MLAFTQVDVCLAAEAALLLFPELPNMVHKMNYFALISVLGHNHSIYRYPISVFYTPTSICLCPASKTFPTLSPAYINND